MSKNSYNQKNKLVVTTKSKIQSTKSKASGSAASAQNNMLFGKSNYILIGLGVLLIFVGMLIMAGGRMPDRNIWDENLIYGWRRTLLAPIVILSGLGVACYAIFKK